MQHRRARKHASDPRRLASLREAVAASPWAGPYASNVKAKEWDLVAPDGTVFQFRNLSLFIRENAHLFDPSDIFPIRKDGKGPSRAAGGLAKLHPDRKSRVYSWRGWRWNAPFLMW